MRGFSNEEHWAVDAGEFERGDGVDGSVRYTGASRVQPGKRGRARLAVPVSIRDERTP